MDEIEAVTDEGQKALGAMTAISFTIKALTVAVPFIVKIIQKLKNRKKKAKGKITFECIKNKKPITVTLDTEWSPEKIGKYIKEICG